jgi:hypothetical protein
MELIETLTDRQFNRLVFLEKYLRLQDSKMDHLKKEFLKVQEAAVVKNRKIKALKAALTTRDLLIEKLFKGGEIEEGYVLRRFAHEVSRRLHLNIQKQDSISQIVSKILAEKLKREDKYKMLAWAYSRKDKEVYIWKNKIQELHPELLQEIFSLVDEMRESFPPAPSIEAASFCKERAKDRAESEQGAQPLNDLTPCLER